MEKELALKAVTDIRNVVSEDEVTLAKLEFRARLILSDITKENIMQSLFEAYNTNASISIKELIKELTRKPLELPYDQSLILARYTIEPRDTDQIEFNIHREKSIETLKQSLTKILELACNIEEDSIERTLQKVKPKQIQLIDQLTNKKEPNQWMKVLKAIDPNLTQLDKDIIIAIGFEKSKDIRKLSATVCLRCNEV